MLNGTHLTLGLSAAVLPLAVAADAVPIPAGVHPLVVMLIAALGPSCVGLVHLLGKTVFLSLSSYFHARSQYKEKQGQKLLADKDKSNDSEGEKLLLAAKAEEGVAQALKDAALKVKG